MFCYRIAVMADLQRTYVCAQRGSTTSLYLFARKCQRQHKMYAYHQQMPFIRIRAAVNIIPVTLPCTRGTCIILHPNSSHRLQYSRVELC